MQRLVKKNGRERTNIEFSDSKGISRDPSKVGSDHMSWSLSNASESLTEIIKFLEVLAPFFLGSIIKHRKHYAILKKGVLSCSAPSLTGYPSLTLPAGSLLRVWSIPSWSLIVFHHSLSTFIMSSNTAAWKMTLPAKTVRRCGCNLRTNSVQIPKFEPPPRMAQNRSAFSDSLTVRAVPFAVTIVAYI